MTPDEYTNQEFTLEVDKGHELYIQDWGNKNSKTPIMFLHGGPGSGCKDGHKQRFDPTKQRVIFHDQRGSGRSTPRGLLKRNTTADLIEDIERIAVRLRLHQFVLTGASWGSGLSFAYALRYPKRVKGMVLAGIFTGSQDEIDWVDEGSWREFYPEIWEKYLAETPKIHRREPTDYHAKRILGRNEADAKHSAYAYATMTGAISSLDDRHVPGNFDEFDPSAIRIEVHYLQKHCFLPDKHILKNAHKLTMPIWMIQNRYDMICPPITAYQLERALPDAQLVWTIGGHHNEREGWNVMRTILLQMTGGK